MKQEDALQRATEYFEGNEVAAANFITKYALRDKEGNLLESSPDQMHRRLAKEFARVESKKFKNPLSEDEIYSYLYKFEKIIPQGSPMYGIGNKHRIVSLSNCYVVDSPMDSYGGICQTDEQIAQISKRRGGIGFDISKLRPESLPVNNSAETTTGAVSFMHRFSNTGREVGQHGRRAAEMITISVHHPDIEKFATIKNDKTSVTGANISVRLTNEFMDAVRNDESYEQRWPVDDTNCPTVSREVSARQVWNTIIHSAWFRAEPGLLFWDNIIKNSPADCYEFFKTISTNPCGEIPLSAYDSCRLLAINLFHCVDNPFTSKAKFNFERLRKTAMVAQRLMDNLVDLEMECINKIIKKIEDDPEPEEIKETELQLWKHIKEACMMGRRTGTGITALGDTLAALGYKYGSYKSVQVTGEIYKTLKLGCYESSVKMAEELGAFPAWDWELEKDCPFLLQIKEEDPKLYARMKKFGRRNIALLTTAPTGTVSTVASMFVNDRYFFYTTNGIEPCYYISFLRRKKINHSDEAKVHFVDDLGDKWTEFKVFHSGVAAWMHATGKTDQEESPYQGAVAADIDWINRVKLQAAAQKHIDHSISSTINLPNDVKEEEVAKIYETAWEAGTKGITVYRDGCRDGVILQEGEKNLPEKRPRELPCDVHHVTVKGQKYFVMVGLYEDQPYEVFAGKNGFMNPKIETGKIIRKRKDFYKAEFDGFEEELSPITATTDEMEECVSRLCSGLLRTGADTHFIVRQLERVGEKQTELHSFAKAMGRCLKKYIPDGTKEGTRCPNCDSEHWVRQEGCLTCLSCGHSKCM